MPVHVVSAQSFNQANIFLLIREVDLQRAQVHSWSMCMNMLCPSEGMLFEVLDMVVQKLINVHRQPRFSCGSLKMFLKAFKLNLNLAENCLVVHNKTGNER